MTKILIIDDEPGIRSALASILEDEGYKTLTAEDALLGMEILKREPINLVFLDVLLPNLGGIEALERIRREWPDIETVVISGHANIDMAVKAVKLGAFDFLEKPLSLDRALTVCRNALELQKLRRENASLKLGGAFTSQELIGTSEAIQRVRELILQAASSDARILISGENGVGKELVARAIHRYSSRSHKAFVEVNCAAIPDSLLESELFGHEKGAFTGAIASRKGRFELASGGSLFLDEIGDMSLSAQAKALRVIQEQKLQRLGGEKTIDIDARIIAATNKDLERECAQGTFRQDLFFRLNVIPIKIPSLRDRREDIPLLLRTFLEEFGAGHIELEEEAVKCLMDYDWPGNVRELRNLAERILVMYRGEKIGAETIKDLVKNQPSFSGKNFSHSPQESMKNDELRDILNLKYDEAKRQFEIQYLAYQLARNDGIVSRTAAAIGIYPSNLHIKIRKYNIRTEQ